MDPVYNFAVAISKSDTVNIDHPAKKKLTDAIQIGGAGIVVCVLEDDSTVAITATAGDILPLRVKRVNSGTTSATVMTALYQI